MPGVWLTDALQHVFYFVAALGLIMALAMSAFATSFTLEESYPDWAQRPGMRVMPDWIFWLTLAEMAFLMVSVIWPRVRHWAATLVLPMLILLWGTFYLIINDIVISRAIFHG